MAQQLTITVNDQGGVSVDGPIKDIVRSYGLLELAKDAIREYHEQQKQQVRPATPEQAAALGGVKLD